VDIFSLIPGTQPHNPGPLARFLPPLEDGVVASWLEENLQPGAWILDPFGSAPRLALEAARAGYRVLVTANNPITRFMLEMGTASPPEAEFQAALADLAVSRKGDERLEAHLQALYLTPCTSCGEVVPAQAFLWRKGEGSPFGRIYECKACGESGEKLCTPSDAERAQQITRTAGLHRARVLERVAPLDHPDREYAEEAIQHYLPRAVYALATLINRLESLKVSPDRRRALTALILSACDRGNTLWPHPTERPRPKQLSTPPQFREQNIWMALEEAIALWSAARGPVPCLHWKNIGQKLPESGGILLYEGRIRDLAGAVKDAPIQALVSALPRPNQAFWTLSALWSGWLWGREAAEPFKTVLRRRRYDWGWQTAALYAALQHAFELLPLGAPIFSLLAEPEPGLLSATLMAASSAGFDLHGLAMRTAHDPIQLHWRRGERLAREQGSPSLAEIREGLHAHLRERGEAAPYLHLYAAGLASQVQAHALIRQDHNFDEALRENQSVLQQAIEKDSSLERQDSPDRSMEVGLWGLREGEPRSDPLPDRVEKTLVELLQAETSWSLPDLERSLYAQFPGLVTPSKGLVAAVLESYAVQESGRWRLRLEDRPASRRADLREMEDLLERIGARLEYTTERLDERTSAWSEGGKKVRIFYLLASALVARVLNEVQHPAKPGILVIPGGRAGLLAYKQNRDPKLRQSLEAWCILKFRLLRTLAEIPVLNRQTFEEQIVSDPVEQLQGQLMMF
jgi:hypothetical protein